MNTQLKGSQLHFVQDNCNGQRKPERRSFYEAVANTLRGVDRAMIFASSTSASSAMDQLLATNRESSAKAAL